MHLHSGLQGHASPKPSGQSVASISIQGRREATHMDKKHTAEGATRRTWAEHKQHKTALLVCENLCVCVGFYLFKDIVMKEQFGASCNFMQTACGQHMVCVWFCASCSSIVCVSNCNRRTTSWRDRHKPIPLTTSGGHHLIQQLHAGSLPDFLDDGSQLFVGLL